MTLYVTRLASRRAAPITSTLGNPLFPVPLHIDAYTRITLIVQAFLKGDAA